MNVARVYTRNVVATRHSSNLQQAAMLMRERHVGALLVIGDEARADSAVGIITDRDLVVQAMAEGVNPQEAKVGDVMTPDVATIGESADIHEAMETMRELGVRRLAVTGEDDTIVGILSFDDIIDALATEVASLADIIRSECDREADELG